MKALMITNTPCTMPLNFLEISGAVSLTISAERILLSETTEIIIGKTGSGFSNVSNMMKLDSKQNAKKKTRWSTIE